MNCGLYRYIGTTEILGKRGEELVHVGLSMVEQGRVCVFQERTQMALREGQQGPEHVCNECKGKTAMRKGNAHKYKIRHDPINSINKSTWKQEKGEKNNL